MKTSIRFRLLAGLLFGAATLVYGPAQAQQMNYQGRLTDASGNPVPDGQHSLKFSLWDAATAGTKVWGPFTTDGGVGDGHAPSADLVNGRFNVILGPNDANGLPLVNGFGGGTRYLEIQDGLNPPISPRQQVLAAPEALHALAANTVPNGAIGTAQLADGSVTAAKISGGTGTWLAAPDGTSIYRSAGNVGIGTTTPGDSLQIGSLGTSSDQYLSLKSAGGNLWRTGIKFRHFSDTGGFNIEDSEATPNGLSFIRYPFGTPVSAMFIDRFNGNVGIGTTNPIAKLDVNGDLKIKGERPFAFQHFSLTNATGSGLVNIDTGWPTNRYVASIAGFQAFGGDVNEYNSPNSNLMMVRATPSTNNPSTWIIHADFNSTAALAWQITAMRVIRELVTDDSTF